MTSAVWPATYSEIFPTKVRLSGIAVGTQFAFPVIGFAPTIAVVLAGGTASGWLPVSIAGSRVLCDRRHLDRPGPGDLQDPGQRTRHQGQRSKQRSRPASPSASDSNNR